MLLSKTLSKHEVLEAITKLTMENLPDDFQGDINLCYTEDGGIEIYLHQETNEELN